MNLSSVRDLKLELKETPVIPTILATALNVRGVEGVAPRVTMRLDAVHTRSPEANNVALGVAPGARRNDYRLGVRIQTSPRAARALAKEFREKTAGEADIRIVPHVVKRSPSPSWFQRRQRPLEAGLSIGHYQITAGTLGFVVEDRDAYYALSNNHVLADVNRGEAGDPVLQPGPADKPPAENLLVGVLDRFVPVSFVRSNVVDCAVAELLTDLEFYPGWTEAIPGRVSGVAAITPDHLGRPVSKAGRTTGVTRGTITQIEVDRLSVDMGEPGNPKVALFSDQFEVEGTDGSFSAGGDSGSLIVNDAGKAVGLLFAGGPDERGRDLTYANRIETALAKLGVSLVL